MPKAYDAYTVTGQQIVVNTTSTDRLAQIVADPAVSLETRQAAAALLEYAAEAIEKGSQCDQLSAAANRMVLELALSDCWPLGSVGRLVTGTRGGKTHRSIVPIV